MLAEDDCTISIRERRISINFTAKIEIVAKLFKQTTQFSFHKNILFKIIRLRLRSVLYLFILTFAGSITGILRLI